MDRKERNGTLKSEWDNDVRKWEVKRNHAKCERRKPRWTKPKKPTVEKPIPKPKVANFREDNEGEEEMEGVEEEEDFDDGMRDSDGGDSD